MTRKLRVSRMYIGLELIASHANGPLGFVYLQM